MNAHLSNASRRIRPIWLLPLTVAGLVIAGHEWLARPQQMRPAHSAAPSVLRSSDQPQPPIPRGPSADRVRRLCASCHALPPPHSFPSHQWSAEVAKGFQFARDAAMQPQIIAPEHEVVQYYTARAPERFEVPTADAVCSPVAGRFVARHYGVPGVPVMPGVTNVAWVPGASPQLDCLVSDMRYGQVFLWEHANPAGGLRSLARVGFPAHAEVYDLDQDGHRDILVADLGDYFPGDSTRGRVLWLRQDPKTNRHVPMVLAQGLGRVADVQAADFDGDGDADLIVAVFGWRSVGRVLYLENRTRDYREPIFEPATVDPRTGAIHVPVADLNGDGRLDFVALLSQQHEEIVAFLNDGGGSFQPKTIHSARNPAYGSTGIELVDFDRDGDLDVLYSNGDLMDSELIKPYHGVQWLENRGTYPFRYHPLATMPGVYNASAGDFDNDNDTDVVAVAWIPDTDYPQRKPFSSIVWIEQREQGRFVSHTIETVACDHTSVAVADYDGDGDLDFVTGNMTWDGILVPPKLPPKAGWITIWENQGPPAELEPFGDHGVKQE